LFIVIKIDGEPAIALLTPQKIKGFDGQKFPKIYRSHATLDVRS
jgi:hypothetical protein